MDLERLHAPFGAAVYGLDISAGIDDSEFRELTEALYEHQIVILKNQALDRHVFNEFGRRWGKPIPHALEHMRMPGYPELLEVGNLTKHAEDEATRNGAVFWHCDHSYEAVPASATMLYAVKAPDIGGETMIANLKLAYEGLDSKTKKFIDNLIVKHAYGAASGQEGEHKVVPPKNAKQLDKLPPVTHPLVRPHEVTGVKTLFAIAGTNYGIENMEEQESLDLIKRLKAHALQEKYVYRHKYEVGDVAIWDNQMTLHSGTAIDLPTGANTERVCWRISIRGKPTIYQ